MNQMSESAVPLVLSRIIIATTLHQHGKTNLSPDGLTCRKIKCAPLNTNIGDPGF